MRLVEFCFIVVGTFGVVFSIAHGAAAAVNAHAPSNNDLAPPLSTASLRVRDREMLWWPILGAFVSAFVIAMVLRGFIIA